MKIIVLNSIKSTQDYLKNILESQDASAQAKHLIYTHNQIAGYGRQQSQWEHTKGSLACSFNMQPHSVFTLSSLEIAVLVSEHFKEKLNLSIKLKWPNDLFYLDKKLGGIIIHSVKGELCIGLGINHSDKSSEIESAMRIGVDLKNLNVEELIKYIHDNRIQSPVELKRRWLENCHHFNRNVRIDKEEGIFVGIGDYGEALLNKNGKISKSIAGSLRYL